MSTAAIRGDWVGRVVDGRFPLLQWLGGSEKRGVFLTEASGPGSQRAAIKLIAADEAEAAAYRKGWATAEKLSHPHLMRLLETGRCEMDGSGLLYVVMEYADEVLAEVLGERSLKPDEVKDLLVPVLDALFYLHGKGLVHGHVRPSNILAVRNHLQLSSDGLEMAGEPGKHYGPLQVYDAPEVGSGEIKTSADVWSLGVTMVEALTQHPPRWERSGGREPAVPVGIPQPFARMARESLRLNAAQRCTLTDLNKARLEDVRYGAEPEAKGSSAATFRPRKSVEAKPGGNRLGLMVAAGAMLALILVIALVKMHSHGTRPSQAEVKQASTQAGAESSRPEVAAKPVRASQAKARAQVSHPARAPEPAKAAVPDTGAAESRSAAGAVVQRVMPEAPQSALNTIHGTVQVWVRVTVDASGNVSKATFESVGPSRYFAKLAMEAAQKWRFKAGAPGGWRLAFQFRQTGIDAEATELQA
jgi:TonB family protein